MDSQNALYEVYLIFRCCAIGEVFEALEVIVCNLYKVDL